VRGCDRSSVSEIGSQLASLVAMARSGSLGEEHCTGSTFTISNLAAFGIRESSAIINPPESAVLAAGEIAKRTVVDDNDVISIRPMMTLTLSCDHRILDGAVSAAFMQTFKALLEDPSNLVL